MFQTKAYISKDKDSNFEEGLIPRRGVGPDDILIEVMFVGINNYDLKNYANKDSIFPMVPGLEVSGVIQNVGGNVIKFGPGMLVGVSKIVDSCRECDMCLNKHYSYCEKGPTFIYNDRNNYNHSNEMGFPTFGGLSQVMVVNKDYVIRIDGNVNLAKLTPLLYTGSLSYSPMKNYGLKPGHKIGIIGINEVGQIAVKLAVSLGADVTVFDNSDSKKSMCLYELKADEFINTNNKEEFNKYNNTFDFILDTRFESDSINNFVELLKMNGEISIINKSSDEISDLIKNCNIGNKTIKKASLPSHKEIQELVSLCAYNKIYCDTELLYAYQINEALEIIKNSENKSLLVIDVNTIAPINNVPQKNLEDEINKAVNDINKEMNDDYKLPSNNRLETYIEEDEESELESDSD